jgi:dephospho-CoA kinase
MIIIGITGTLGAGKGTVVQYLVNEMGFVHFSVRGYITQEIIKRGLEVDRNSMTDVANDLRLKHSPSYIVDRLYEDAAQTGNDCVIESIRTPGEIESLRRKGKFFLFAVDAPVKVRFDRIRKRASETDDVDFQTFVLNETREMTSDDPHKQNLKKCIEMADFVFNNSDAISDLEKQVAAAIHSISN